MADSRWVAKNDSVVQQFMRTPFWAKLSATPNLLFILVGGSRYYGDTYLGVDSDYDLIAVVENETYIQPQQFVKISGKSFHWTIQSISTYVSSKVLELPFCITWALYAGGVKFNRFSRDLILYENPKYTKVVDTLIIQKAKIQRLYFYKSIVQVNQALTRRDYYNKVTELYAFPKTFYHLFAAYKDITGIGDIDWIRQIKFRQIATNEGVKQILSFFDKILTWCELYPINLSEEEENLYGQFFNGCGELLL